MTTHTLISTMRELGAGKWLAALCLLGFLATLIVMSERGLISRWVLPLCIAGLAMAAVLEIVTAVESSVLDKLSKVSGAMLAIMVMAAAFILCYAWLSGDHWIVYMVACGAAASDISAQFGGKLWRLLPDHPLKAEGMAQPKLLVYISPNKSYTGYIAGMAGGSLAVAIALAWSGQLVYWQMILLVPFAAEIGDLLASWLKRQCGIKDYTILWLRRPLLGWNTGGIYDRGDSHFFAVFIVGLTLLLL